MEVSELVQLIPPEITACGGSEGAGCYVGSIIVAAFARGRRINGFIVRNQPKDHGTHQLVEGHLKAGDHVLVIDLEDDATAHVFEVIQHAGATVNEVFSIGDPEGALK